VHNGTYLSNPIALNSDSEFLALSWTASTPASTSVRLSMRTGAAPTTWNPWHRWSVAGTYVLSVENGAYVQVSADLNTTNASAVPTVQSLSLTTRHHPSSGTVISGVAPVQGKFLRWRGFSALAHNPSGTDIALAVGNGSYWTDLPRNGSLAFFPGSVLMWRATLTTTDGVLTPALSLVTIAYEYVGAPAALVLFPGGPVDVAPGGTVQFTAAAVDSGNHTVPGVFFDWHTSDPSGQVTNGLYVAGQPGTWNVTAVAVGWGVSQTVQVRVSSNPFALLWPIAGAAVIIGVLAFVGYDVAIRRMYAIDDVFLIAKDGRLILHNTRRMRADRDEDILSGMLTAIMAFLRDSDPEENGEFKQFEVGGKTTLLERGTHVYLTAIYSGRVPGWARKDLHRFVIDLEARFGEAFARWTGSPEDLHGLKEYMQRFVTHMRYRGDSRARRPPN
jgi:hypothetical protein